MKAELLQCLFFKQQLDPKVSTGRAQVYALSSQSKHNWTNHHPVEVQLGIRVKESWGCERLASLWPKSSWVFRVESSSQTASQAACLQSVFLMDMRNIFRRHVKHSIWKVDSKVQPSLLVLMSSFSSSHQQRDPTQVWRLTHQSFFD